MNKKELVKLFLGKPLLFEDEGILELIERRGDDETYLYFQEAKGKKPKSLDYISFGFPEMCSTIEVESYLPKIIYRMEIPKKVYQMKIK
ncbi:MAG: hypothetical protein AABX88_01895 [Nanoarchaeota archaeon]